MSQKRSKQERKQKEEEKKNSLVVTTGPKPIFVRIYDKLIPSEYTKKQDFHHMIAVFIFILALGGAIAFGWWNVTQREIDSTSSMLLIPKTSFVEGQQNNVTSMLEGYGFKNISFDENGNAIAYGTEAMVHQYKESYRNDILAPVQELMEKDYTLYGITSITLSDDAKTLTMKTIDDLSESSTIMSYSVTNNSIDKIIYVCSNWCQIRNDGEKMTVNLEFIGEDAPYYSFQAYTGGSIVAQLEAEERAKANVNNASDNDTKNLSINENESKAENTNTGEKTE